MKPALYPRHATSGPWPNKTAVFIMREWRHPSVKACHARRQLRLAARRGESAIFPQFRSCLQRTDIKAFDVLRHFLLQIKEATFCLALFPHPLLYINVRQWPGGSSSGWTANRSEGLSSVWVFVLVLWLNRFKISFIPTSEKLLGHRNVLAIQHNMSNNYNIQYESKLRVSSVCFCGCQSIFSCCLFVLWKHCIAAESKVQISPVWAWVE